MATFAIMLILRILEESSHINIVSQHLIAHSTIELLIGGVTFLKLIKQILHRQLLPIHKLVHGRGRLRQAVDRLDFGGLLVNAYP